MYMYYCTMAPILWNHTFKGLMQKGPGIVKKIDLQQQYMYILAIHGTTASQGYYTMERDNAMW